VCSRGVIAKHQLAGVPTSRCTVGACRSFIVDRRVRMWRRRGEHWLSSSNAVAGSVGRVWTLAASTVVRGAPVQEAAGLALCYWSST